MQSSPCENHTPCHIAPLDCNRTGWAGSMRYHEAVVSLFGYPKPSFGWRLSSPWAMFSNLCDRSVAANGNPTSRLVHQPHNTLRVSCRPHSCRDQINERNNMSRYVRPKNLNDVFQAAANQARQKPLNLSHNQKARHPTEETRIAFASHTMPSCCRLLVYTAVHSRLSIPGASTVTFSTKRPPNFANVLTANGALTRPPPPVCSAKGKTSSSKICTRIPIVILSCREDPNSCGTRLRPCRSVFPMAIFRPMLLATKSTRIGRWRSQKMGGILLVLFLWIFTRRIWSRMAIHCIVLPEPS